MQGMQLVGLLPVIAVALLVVLVEHLSVVAAAYLVELVAIIAGQ